MPQHGTVDSVKCIKCGKSMNLPWSFRHLAKCNDCSGHKIKTPTGDFTPIPHFQSLTSRRISDG